MNADPFDTRKQGIESAMLSNAEDKAKVAAFGKAAYLGYCGDSIRKGWYYSRWENLSPEEQCSWVEAAQAVIDEARRSGWI